MLRLLTAAQEGKGWGRLGEVGVRLAALIKKKARTRQCPGFAVVLSNQITYKGV